LEILGFFFFFSGLNLTNFAIFWGNFAKFSTYQKIEKKGPGLEFSLLSLIS
jgi:hypothetical protein